MYITVQIVYQSVIIYEERMRTKSDNLTNFEKQQLVEHVASLAYVHNKILEDPLYLKYYIDEELVNSNELILTGKFS